jgi:hypothetical protein
MIPHHAAFSPKSAEGSLPPEGVKKLFLDKKSLDIAI